MESEGSRVGSHYRPHLAPGWDSVIFRGVGRKKKKLAKEIWEMIIGYFFKDVARDWFTNVVDENIVNK